MYNESGISEDIYDTMTKIEHIKDNESGITVDIYDTMNKLENIKEYNKPGILFRLLMDYISNRKRYHKFKESLRHSYKSIYNQIKFVG